MLTRTIHKTLLAWLLLVAVSSAQQQQPPQMQSEQSAVPVPDPTIRTQENQLREIANLRAIIETRLDGMDRAIDLRQKATSSAVDKLQELLEEKFASIAIQFAERDTRTEQTSRDSKVAVDAALQAAKEAVAEQNRSNALAMLKSEAGFTKQIDQIGELLKERDKSIDTGLDDLKARITTIEGRTVGIGQSWMVLVGVAGVVLAVVAILVRPAVHAPPKT